MFTYVHNVDAYVENHIKYLTDVVKVAIEKVEILDHLGAGTGVFTYDVSVYPAVQQGSTTITPVPVHPKTPEDMVPTEVPVYGVPTKLKALVPVKPEDREQDTAGANIVNWREVEVDVAPLAFESYDTEEEALVLYSSVVAQLHEGETIRNLNHGRTLRNPYETDNSRSH